MYKGKSIIKINRLLFAQLIIILNPLIDITYNILKKSNINLPINLVVRFTIMVIALLYLKKWKSFKYIAIYSIFLLMSLMMQYKYEFLMNYQSDIGFYIKLLSNLILYMFYYELFDRGGNDVVSNKVFKSMIVSAEMIGIIIITCAIFGIGYRNYGGNLSGRMSGYLGFFSGNSITVASLMIVLVPNFILNYKKNYIPIIINIIGILLVLSKAAVFGTAIIFACMYIYDIYCTDKRKRGRKIALGIMFIIPMLVIISPIVWKYIQNLIMWSNTQRYDNFYTMLTSNRGLQIDLIKKYYHSTMTPIQQKICILFGGGYSKTNYFLNSAKKEFMAIEWDFHGLYYYSGLFICVIQSVFLLTTLIRGFTFIKNKKLCEGWLVISVLSTMLYALTGGHVLYESMTMQYFVVVLAYINVLYKKRKKYINDSAAILAEVPME